MKFADDIIKSIEERGPINTENYVVGEDFEKYLRGVRYKYTIDKKMSFILFNNTLKNIINRSFFCNDKNDNWFIVDRKLTEKQIKDLEIGVKIIKVEEI